ncbi:MAG: c-type cytochrome [Leptolyngbyaceae bacterium]|nr:c-type cytochrome [Leptolyngbyaceae bacterium]
MLDGLSFDEAKRHLHHKASPFHLFCYWTLLDVIGSVKTAIVNLLDFLGIAMKRVIRLSLWLVLICSIAVFGIGSSPAFAADLANGAQVFSANCNACHAGGNNYVNAAKSLRKGDLEKYDMASLEAIKTQVTNGKLAMPAFGGKLSAQEIENVAAYVLDQAEKGW